MWFVKKHYMKKASVFDSALSIICCRRIRQRRTSLNTIFDVILLFAVGGTRTPKSCDIRTWSARVYQFHHDGMLSAIADGDYYLFPFFSFFWKNAR